MTHLTMTIVFFCICNLIFLQLFGVLKEGVCEEEGTNVNVGMKNIHKGYSQ